jgi:hypothetical protein
MNLYRLIELALGVDEARKVDTSIPQQIFDGMNQAQRANIAGWYYSPKANIFGELLTKEQCWKKVMDRLLVGGLTASMAGLDVTYRVKDWPCLQSHVLAGEVILEERPL